MIAVGVAAVVGVALKLLLLPGFEDGKEPFYQPSGPPFYWRR
jgi:hypothetical protein